MYEQACHTHTHKHTCSHTHICSHMHTHTDITHMQEGLSKVLPQAERSSYGKELFDVEEKARAARKNVWEDYVEPQPQEDEGEVEGAGEEEQQGPPPERKCDYQKVWRRRR